MPDSRFVLPAGCSVRRHAPGLLILVAIMASASFTDLSANGTRSGSAGYFVVGPGFTDVGSHQIVRSADDRLYVFAGQGQYSSRLTARWTTAAGLPATAGAFDRSIHATAPANIMAVDAAYDGRQTIHVLAITNGGSIVDYPFDTQADRFLEPKLLADGVPIVSGDYLGSGGVAGMVDADGTLHVAHWSRGDRITYRAYSYAPAADALQLVEGPTQLDLEGSANHPALAIAPTDGAVTVAWISQATRPAGIQVRARKGAGVWDRVETVSRAPVWTSPHAGINIDQGPSLLIGPDGRRHLLYIEDWDSTGEYGRVHYVTSSGTEWLDRPIPSLYSHDPALAIAREGDLYLIGHGHPNNLACRSMRDLCVAGRRPDGEWETATVFARAQGTESFDSSPSVKWSAVGLNRPETIEFLFFSANAGSYANTTIYYGRL